MMRQPIQADEHNERAGNAMGFGGLNHTDETDDRTHANRYHQSLGAKWMVEAIIRECRTKFRLNRNAQEFANDLERRWENEAFWRPKDFA